MTYFCRMKNPSIEDLLPAAFPGSSKAWIFQSGRPFSEKEEQEINEQLYQFYSQWLSHGEAVKGWAKLLFRQFVIVLADETATSLGGCSTDGMIRVIKSLERQYSVNFFDRMMLTLLVNGKAEMMPSGQLSYALEKCFVDADTLVFNNIATTKNDLLHTWLVPLKESWAGTYLEAVASR